MRWVLGLAMLCCVWPAAAQLAAKPSAFRAPDEHDPLKAVAEAYLPSIGQRVDFNRLARRYNRGTAFELPHVLFLIDRTAADRVYFINTRRFDLHEHFMARGPLHLKTSRAELASNYRSPSRRFILGVVSWQAATRQWTWESWEGDRLTEALLREAQGSLQAAFFEPLLFKANSRAHEVVAESAGLPYVSQARLIEEQSFLPLNQGVARGRIKLVPLGGLVADADPHDILVLDEVPISLPPVAGVITSRPSTAISHVNLLAKGWGIPNAWVRDALAALAPYDRQWVELQVTRTGYQVKPIAPLTLASAQQKRALPRPVLTRRDLVPLARLRVADHVHCGSKAANLGAVMASHVPEVSVPDGFCIPFAQYADFMRSAAARALIEAATHSPGFDSNAAARHAALDRLRADLIALPVPDAQTAAWMARWQGQLGGAGVFVRSSSNSEDLPGFSGAGLYTTVPNVRQADALVMAVKTVWASVFNIEAYEARRVGGIPLDAVAMGVLVQTAADSKRSGVMITRDPFDAAHRSAVYIAAKRGIGIKVVEGRRIAEQVMIDTRTHAAQWLSEADEDSELRLDASGGVSEQKLDSASQRTRVLDEATVRRLARVGEAIRRVFKGREQDIEWATVDEQRIVVLQARPYGAAVRPVALNKASSR
ncbi:MAG: PEP/pyruvate-binding domain-containing protein [Rhodocyclaceae bacterium]